MLLRRLKEYADERMALPPTLYSDKPVRYIIELDATGRLLNPQPTDTADASNPKTRRGQLRLVPDKTRAVGISPLLFADNAEYTFGLAREASKPDRVSACHQSYLALVDRCVTKTQNAAVTAVQAFLQSDPSAQVRLPDTFDRSAIITFRVGGAFPTELEAVQHFWADENDPAGRDARIMQCIICGQKRPVLERLQGKVRGVPREKASGTSIISANRPAFLSYGLAASYNAPTCADCGERFTKAINQLLSDTSSRVKLNGVAFIFWTRQPVGFDLNTFLDQAAPQEVRALIETVHSGRRMPDVDDTAFYATVLSASGGRTVIRDWIDTTVGEVKQQLGSWFQRQAIIDDRGQPPRPLNIYSLARSTVFDTKDIPTTTTQWLIHAALRGTPLPMSLLYQAVRRNRATQSVTRERAALIKLVLLSQRGTHEENAMFELDGQNTNYAYLCGRLLAVLAEVQRNAIGKAAIVDRFYGTASSAPAAVFGRLLRGAQPHLSKLERDRPSVASALQRRLEEIMSALDGFPTTLTLEEQGLFALGFYHQRAHDRTMMIAAAERKKLASKADSTSAAEDHVIAAAEEPVI